MVLTVGTIQGEPSTPFPLNHGSKRDLPCSPHFANVCARKGNLFCHALRGPRRGALWRIGCTAKVMRPTTRRCGSKASPSRRRICHTSCQAATMTGPRHSLQGLLSCNVSTQRYTGNEGDRTVETPCGKLTKVKMAVPQASVSFSLEGYTTLGSQPTNYWLEQRIGRA